MPENSNVTPSFLKQKIRTIDVDSKTIKLQLWDTAGQERFKTITSTYYRSAQGIMIVYDVTNQDSFANIQRQWLPEIQRYASSNVSLVLVGNKSDLSNKRVISTEEGKALADTLGVSFVETSARTATQVEAAFTMISAEIMERLEKDFLNTSKRQVQYPSPTVSLSRNGKQTSGCCFSA